MKRKYVCAMLALMLASSMSMPVLAASTSNVTLQVTPTDGGGGDGGDEGGGEGPELVKVEIPSDIPLSMDPETGEVTVASNLAIQNLDETQNVEVTGIAVEGSDIWSIKDYDTDLAAQPANTHELAMTFRGDKTTDGGQVHVTPDKWVIDAATSLPLDVTAKMPLQNDGTYDERKNIATVNWTIKATEEEPPVNSSTISNNWNAETTMLPSSTKEVTFDWSSTKKDASIVSVESSHPEVATINEVTKAVSDEQPYNGEKTYTVTGVAKGKTTITATMDTGETTSFEMSVSELKSDGTIDITLPDTGLQPGDDLNNSDITVDIPITTPDGDSTLPIKPTFPEDVELQPGDNEIEVDVDVNGVNIHIKITITIKVENPSDGLTQSIEEAQAMGFTFESFEDGLSITKFENKQFKKEVNVPEQIGEFKVKKIGSNAFKNQSNLTRITLPETLTNIDGYAFSGCSNLTELTIPHGVTLPSNSTFPFSGAGSPDGTLTINCDVPRSNYQSTGHFSNSSFGHIIIGETVNSIAKEAFYGNKNIKDITILSPNLSVGDQTFAYLGTELAPIDVTIKANLSDTSEYYSLFDESYISSLIIEEGVTSIGEAAFYDCNAIETITLPNSLQKIGRKAFSGITKGPKEIEIPKNVATIEELAFGGISHITYHGYATGAPWGAKTMNISNITNDWDTSTDMLVTATKNVIFEWESPQEDAHIVKIESSNPEIATVSEVTSENKSGTTGSKEYVITGIAKGTAVITATMNTGEISFFTVDICEIKEDVLVDGAVNIIVSDMLQLGDKMTDIGLSVDIPISKPNGDDIITVTPAFSDASLILGSNTIETNVTINGVIIPIKVTVNVKENPSDGLSMSGEEANELGLTFSSYQDGLKITNFKNVNKKVVNIPEQIDGLTVKAIGEDAFDGEDYLTKITMPSTIETIERYAFYQCSGLKRLIIPDSVKTIANGIISDCTNLEYCELGKNITFDEDISIADYSGVKNSTLVIKCDLPNSNIGPTGSTFRNTKFTNIIIDNTVKRIGAKTFFYNNTIESIQIGDNVTEIGDQAFGNMSNIKSIVIPDTVKTIGSDAFKNIPHITYHGPASGSPWGATAIN